jgi:hypothetical protein
MPYKNKKDLIARNKKYYLINRDKYLRSAKEYRNKNKKIIKIRLKKYYLKNKNKLLKQQKEYRNKNREKLLLYYKIINQKPHRKEARKKWQHKQLKTNFNYRLLNNLRRRLLLSLKGNNKSKTTMKLLGCTIEQLWLHLEKSFKPGMTRHNHGKWHIDHIKPCASFDLSNPKEQAKCFHYTNLQALWAHENLSKGSK